MALGIISKGVYAIGSVGSSITLTETILDVGRTALIFIISDDGAPDSVVWQGGGGHSAELLYTKANATGGITTSLWRIKYITDTDEADIIATWSVANSERLIACVEIEEATVVDAYSTASQNATGSPHTGTAVATSAADTIQVAFFGCNGRTSDTLGTVGDGHTSLDSGGTVAVGTLAHITYETLSASGGYVRASKTGATTRDWANIIVALKKIQKYKIETTYHRPWTSYTDTNVVVLEVSDESTETVFQVKIPEFIIRQMTDTEVRNYVRFACTWHAQKFIINEMPLVTPDTTLEARIAALEGEYFTI